MRRLSACLTLAAVGAACSSGPTAPGRASALLYVANYTGSITVYSANATGNAAPTAAIAGNNTGLNFPYGIARDGTGRLYVTNLSASPEAVTVYAADAAGNAAPIATIAGSSTGLHGAQGGIAVNAAGRLYVPNIGSTDSGDTITVYAPGATGNVTPTATIAGASTGLSVPFGIALDAAGQLYVANAGRSGNGSITVYAPGATGNVTPTATIAGGNTGLTAPSSIALDATGRLYVMNVTIMSNVAYYTIAVYAAGATGNTAPIRMIGGGNTGLSSPLGMAVDGAGRLYVANQGSSSITIYAPGATGNAAPMATIAGNNTGLSGPAYITF